MTKTEPIETPSGKAQTENTVKVRPETFENMRREKFFHSVNYIDLIDYMWEAYAMVRANAEIRRDPAIAKLIDLVENPQDQNEKRMVARLLDYIQKRR